MGHTFSVFVNGKTHNNNGNPTTKIKPYFSLKLKSNNTAQNNKGAKEPKTIAMKGVGGGNKGKRREIKIINV